MDREGLVPSQKEEIKRRNAINNLQKVLFPLFANVNSNLHKFVDIDHILSEFLYASS